MNRFGNALAPCERCGLELVDPATLLLFGAAAAVFVFAVFAFAAFFLAELVLAALSDPEVLGGLG